MALLQPKAYQIAKQSGYAIKHVVAGGLQKKRRKCVPVDLFQVVR